MDQRQEAVNRVEDDRPYTPTSAFIEDVVEKGKMAMSHPKTSGYDVGKAVKQAERQNGLIATVNMGKPLNRLDLARMTTDTQRLYLQNLIDTYNPPIKELGFMLGYKGTGAYASANQMLNRLDVKKKDARSQTQRQLHMWKAFLNGGIAEETSPAEQKLPRNPEQKPKARCVDASFCLCGSASECAERIAEVFAMFGSGELQVRIECHKSEEALL